MSAPRLGVGTVDESNTGSHKYIDPSKSLANPFCSAYVLIIEQTGAVKWRLDQRLNII